MEVDLDKRYLTLLILWFALLISIAVYFLIALVVAPEVSGDSFGSGRTLVISVLAGLGAFLVVLSFVVKRKLLERSVDTQDVSLVQKAMVIACAMCEAAALLGLVLRLIFGGREFYLLMIIAAIGMALHFPRRDHILAASSRKAIE